MVFFNTLGDPFPGPAQKGVASLLVSNTANQSRVPLVRELTTRNSRPASTASLATDLITTAVLSFTTEQTSSKLNMATKKSKTAAPTDDELNKMLEDIDEVAGIAPAKGAPKSTKPATQSEQDLLAELDNLENFGAQPSSRPHTPRIQSIKRTAIATPPPVSSRTSEEKTSGTRKSGDSTRSFHTPFTPSATSSDLQEAEKKTPIAQPAEEAPVAASGGWWGSVFATASAAVKTAENAVKEIQQNEEAKRWAEQVKGNVGVLRGFGKKLSVFYPIATCSMSHVVCFIPTSTSQC